MSWTKITRSQHDRSDVRYASDCSDEEWKLIAPIVTQRSRVGRPRKVRAILVLTESEKPECVLEFSRLRKFGVSS